MEANRKLKGSLKNGYLSDHLYVLEDMERADSRHPVYISAR